MHPENNLWKELETITRRFTMSEKRNTIEWHFGKKWVCTCTLYGVNFVKAVIYQKGNLNAGPNPVYTGIGGFKYRKDFDFDAAAGAAICAALNNAGYNTLDLNHINWRKSE
jgi:hypothetical protein